MTDILGRVTEYKYDLRGDLIAINDPLGQKTEYAYDEEANITRKILAEKVTYHYEYDNLDRLVAVVNQETGITEEAR
jgi:YD repeat-containing protein